MGILGWSSGEWSRLGIRTTEVYRSSGGLYREQKNYQRSTKTGHPEMGGGSGEEAVPEAERGECNQLCQLLIRQVR